MRGSMLASLEEVEGKLQLPVLEVVAFPCRLRRRLLLLLLLLLRNITDPLKETRAQQHRQHQRPRRALIQVTAAAV
jgi:hypothetical protein